MMYKNISKKTLYECLVDTTNLSPNRIAIYFDNQAITYKQLLNLVDQMGQKLKSKGLNHNSIITLISHNSINFIIMFYSISKIGATANVLHYGTSNTEIVDSLELTKSRVIFSDRNINSVIMEKYVTILIDQELQFKQKTEYIETNIDRKGSVILYTSGSTGNPKGAMFEDRQFNEFAIQSYNNHPKLMGNLKTLVTMPLFHGFGLATGVHNTIVFGGTIILMTSQEKNNLPKFLAKAKPNFIIGVPSFFEKFMINNNLNKVDLSNIKNVLIGGSPCDSSFKTRIQNFFKYNHSCATIRFGYGLTECLSGVTLNFNICESDVGKPFEKNKIKISNEEILIKGPTLMKGYINSVSSIDNDGWLHTGDIGYLKNGKLYFVGRKTRSISTSGYLLNLDNIESIISKCPFVDNVAVIAINDKIKDKKIVAFVSTKYPIQKIYDFCLENISTYALPSIQIIDSLPMTDTGKIDYCSLERMYTK